MKTYLECFSMSHTYCTPLLYICKPKYVVSTYLSAIFTCQVIFFTYFSGTSLVRSPSSLEIINLSLDQVNCQILSLGHVTCHFSSLPSILCYLQQVTCDNSSFHSHLQQVSYCISSYRSLLGCL